MNSLKHFPMDQKRHLGYNLDVGIKLKRKNIPCNIIVSHPICGTDSTLYPIWSSPSHLCITNYVHSPPTINRDHTYHLQRRQHNAFHLRGFKINFGFISIERSLTFSLTMDIFLENVDISNQLISFRIRCRSIQRHTFLIGNVSIGHQVIQMMMSRMQLLLLLWCAIALTWAPVASIDEMENSLTDVHDGIKEQLEQTEGPLLDDEMDNQENVLTQVFTTSLWICSD